jgi:hypothetical protein
MQGKARFIFSVVVAAPIAAVTDDFATPGARGLGRRIVASFEQSA